MGEAGLITAGLGLLGGAIEYGLGTYQRHKAEQAARNNVRPTYETPGSEQYLTDLIQSQGNTGMSDASRAAYLNDAQGGLSATTSAILKGGGDPNAIGNAYSGYNKGISQMALYDDSQRMQHLNAVAQNYARQSANQDKLFQLNKFDPYKDKAQAIAQQLAGAQNMQNAGMNTFFGGLGSAGKAIASDNKLKLADNAPTDTPTNAGNQPVYGNADWYNRAPITNDAMLGQSPLTNAINGGSSPMWQSNY